MLTLDDLRLKQGSFELYANFKVPRGANVAVIGPSGSGKSTLLSLIAGFIPPDSGRVTWNETDLTELEPGRRPISILFQDNNLFPHMSAFQNVAVGIHPSLRLISAEIDTVYGALDRVGLRKFSDRKPGELSGGQQSRVALARVLVRDRALLLLDEPFSALGPALKTEMLDLVGELVHDTGATLLMVTHDPRDAKRISDQTILVSDGIAHPPCSTSELLANPPDTLRDYLGN